GGWGGEKGRWDGGGEVGAVGDQQAGFSQLPIGTTRRHSVAHRQHSNLAATAGEERVRGEEEGVGPVASNGIEGRIDFAAGAGVENLEFAVRWRAQPPVCRVTWARQPADWPD